MTKTKVCYVVAGDGEINGVYEDFLEAINAAYYKIYLNEDWHDDYMSRDEFYRSREYANYVTDFEMNKFFDCYGNYIE